MLQKGLDIAKSSFAQFTLCIEENWVTAKEFRGQKSYSASFYVHIISRL